MASDCGPKPLPIAGEGTERAPRVKPSKAGWWRAGVLIGVHIIIAAHIGHWLATGSTVSPLEPSESMEVATRGIVNAGLIFFLLTILSTAVLGRWFCGWACHVVALQDLCRAMMMKVGITPRPLRSRLLMWVPLLAALYMFALPLMQRMMAEQKPPLQVHLTTSTFWATFPTWPVALGTFLVCGFVAVVLLGNKAFCTYGCPYGAIYGAVDKLAPGRIRVTDACNHCGHCTSVCSSNVIVHREVHDYGAVVDPGCMKCLDCVSVCPNDALYFGWGAPAVLTGPRDGVSPKPTKPAFGWGEEALLATAFALAFLAFRGIYGVVPFLFALGLAGCCAFLTLLGARLVRRPSVKLLRWHLKKTGRVTRLGGVFVVGMLPLLALWVHSGLITFRAWRAEALAQETQRFARDWNTQLENPATVTGADRALLESALAHGRFVERWSLLPHDRNDLTLAWLHLLDRDDAGVDRTVGRVLKAVPDAVKIRFRYANFLVRRGRPDEALPLYERVIELQPADAAGARRNVIKLHLEAGRIDAAVAAFEAAIAAHPKKARLRADLGQIEGRRGNLKAAKQRYREAIGLDKTLAGPRAALHTAIDAHLKANRAREALAEADALTAVDAEDAFAHRLAGRALILLTDYPKAEARLRVALALERHPQTLALLAALAKQRGDMRTAIELQREAQRLAKPPR